MGMNMLLLMISGEEEKIVMPLNLPNPQIKAGNKIRVVFWGSSQETINNSDELRKECTLTLSEKPNGCVNYAKKHNLEINMKEIGQSIYNPNR
jgi:hypothetical protein